MSTSSGEGHHAAGRRRGCLVYVRRALFIVVLLSVGLIVLGVVYQNVILDAQRRTYQAPGELFAVDGHMMHISCMGEGSPTVILEAGGISYSSEWYWVQHQLAATRRVCAYDRAGMGWSEASPAPRDGIQVANELHELLIAADIAAPYILAGHSYGGILNRIYADQYPAEVMGIVLVDTAILLPDEFPTQADFDQWKRENDILQGALWAAVRLGVYNLLIDGEIHAFGYPQDTAAELVALRSSNAAFDTYYAEGTLMRRVLTEQSNAASDLGTLPLAAIWATELPPLNAADAARYRTLQDDILTYSSDSAAYYIEGSSHGSIIGNEGFAQQVTDIIRQLAS
ncbi:MAG: alpha/beta hydrolase [Anaerolineae bacterium]